MSELWQLLSFAHVSGCQLTSAMWTCLIARLCRERRLDDAYRMLAKMVGSGSPPTVITYTPLLKGFLQAGMHDLASELMGSMVSVGCSPDIVLYNVLMDCMAKARRYDDALGIYMQIHGSQIKPDAYTLSTLVRVLQLSSYERLLPRIPSLILRSCTSYDLVAFNSVLSALCKSGFPTEAIQFYFHMLEKNIRPDSYTYVSLLHSLCQLEMVNHAINFYRSTAMRDPESNSYVHATILCILVRQGRNLMALRILREAVCENCALDAVCYTIVLHGLFQARLVEEARMLFDQMKQLGMASNTCTYNVMLRGLCRTKDIHAVKQLLTEMENADVEMDSISFNTIVVFLVKSRLIDSAAAMIREMLNLGMKPSTKASSLLSQSIGYKFVLEDNTTTIVDNDGSDSSSDLLVCSAS